MRRFEMVFAVVAMLAVMVATAAPRDGQARQRRLVGQLRLGHRRVVLDPRRVGLGLGLVLGRCLCARRQLAGARRLGRR
jgi:hypothetical protein